MKLDVVSWNVHGWIGSDDRRDPSRAFRLLEEIEPDVVALQEAEGDDWEPLAAAAGYAVVRGHTRPRRFGNALLVRAPLAQVRRLDLSVAQREPRGAIDAVIELSEGPLRLVATHLGLRGWERRRQATMLAARLEAVDAELPCVLVGDLNDWTPRGRQLAALRRTVGALSNVRTFPSRRPIFALDRAAWRVPGVGGRVTRIRHDGVESVSDHLPLRLELSRGS